MRFLPYSSIGIGWTGHKTPQHHVAAHVTNAVQIGTISKMNAQIATWKWNEHMNRSGEEALSELEREAHVRIRCYDRWITEGRVSYVDARDRLERLLTAIMLIREATGSTTSEASSKTPS